MASSVELKVSDLIRNDLRQVLVKELGSEKIDWKVEAGSAKGDNFIGIVYRVVGKLTENDAVTSISVILKIAPTSKARREAIAMREVFLREIKIYEEVLPMFWRFQISKGISPEENGFNEYPKCYKTIDAEINETLILEDLKVLKFELFDRFQIVSIEHMRLIMMALGQYHALSIALKVWPLDAQKDDDRFYLSVILQDQQPQELERFTILEENFLKRIDEKVLIYLEAMLDGAYKSLDHEGDERLLGKMKEFFKRGYDRIMREYCSGKLAEPYTVMCHGDCWNNNVLFKNDEVRSLTLAVVSVAFTFHLNFSRRMGGRLICVSWIGNFRATLVQSPILSTAYSFAPRKVFATCTTMTWSERITPARPKWSRGSSAEC